MIQATFERKTFQFKRPSGTSRGVLTEKHAWFIYLHDTANPAVKGTGECSIIPGLSPDFIHVEAYEEAIENLCDQINESNFGLDTIESLRALLLESPSILFGFEMAVLDLKNGGKGLFYDTPFTRGEAKIPINGLIWMGTEEFMQAQIEEKLQEGYSCIKMKIGAIDFDSEFEMLAALRDRYAADVLTLRVDANGAFSAAEAMGKLRRLADIDVHSIEQPIKAGQLDEMARLCLQSPLPIALDEELIDVYGHSAKKALLERIKPQYIILKPSLHGGFSGCREWIEIANELQVPWWITSALESNVGLNAIAQFTSLYDISLPQGLGTGSLYVENTPTNLVVKGGFIEMKLP